MNSEDCKSYEKTFLMGGTLPLKVGPVLEVWFVPSFKLQRRSDVPELNLVPEVCE